MLQVAHGGVKQQKRVPGEIAPETSGIVEGQRVTCRPDVREALEGWVRHAVHGSGDLRGQPIRRTGEVDGPSIRAGICKALHAPATTRVLQDVIVGLVPAKKLLQPLCRREIATEVELDIDVWRELARARQFDDVVAVRGGGAKLALRFEKTVAVAQQLGNFKAKVLPKGFCRRVWRDNLGANGAAIRMRSGGRSAS